jgi:serine/threonine protein kinase
VKATRGDAVLDVKIDGYALLRRTSIGAMSEVFEARCERTGAVVAIKLLLPHWLADPQMVSRFLGERQLLASIRHPHVVRWLAEGYADDRPYLVLEWVGATLHDVLCTRDIGFDVAPAIHIARRLADALSFLHSRGIVHRDVKPKNVLLGDVRCMQGEVRLADLGLAKAVRVPSEVRSSGEMVISTNHNALFGTWDYMAPEQWVSTKRVDPKADVYSFGALLFHMLTGQPPFIAAEQKDLMYYHVMELPSFTLVPAVVPSDVVELMRRMLSKKTAIRPEMSEVLVHLSGRNT